MEHKTTKHHKTEEKSNCADCNETESTNMAAEEKNMPTPQVAPTPWLFTKGAFVLLIILTVLAILQTVQSYTLYTTIKSGNFGSSPAAATGANSSLPDMVGGC